MFIKLSGKILSHFDGNLNFYRKYFPWVLNVHRMIIDGSQEDVKLFVRFSIFFIILLIGIFVYQIIYYEKTWAVLAILGALIIASLLSPAVRKRFVLKDDRVANFASWMRVITFSVLLIFIGTLPTEREILEKKAWEAEKAEKEAEALRNERTEKAAELSRKFAENQRLLQSLSFKAEYSRLAAPKIMFECNGSTRYLASTGFANYNALLLQAESECGGDFTLISGEK